MKIAYLILAYNNFNHLQRLIDALTTGNTSFYIHIDKRVKNIPALKGNIKFAKRINSYWSTFNCVTPSIELLEMAYKDDNDYYFLISGQDYPIVSNEKIIDAAKEGKEKIFYRKESPAIMKSHYAYNYFIMERRNKSIKFKVLHRIELLSRRFLKPKQDPFIICRGGTWFGVTKKCTEYILNTIKNKKEYVKYFKHTRYPEEAFFCTIVGNSEFDNNIGMDTVYTDWREIHHPAVIRKDHLPLMKETDYLFARKFTDNSGDIIDIIDKEMRAIK